MGQSPKRPQSDTSSETELDHVLVKNSKSKDECILFPNDASEDELQTTWILATEDAYVSVEDVQ